MNIALLTAGGVGTRMNSKVPKQFMLVNEKPVIIHTMQAFDLHKKIDAIAVVCLEGWEKTLKHLAAQYEIQKTLHIIKGGRDGQESIRNGIFSLEKIYKPSDIVVIHDGNRPLVSEYVISDCIEKAEKYGCAIACVPCTEVVLYTEDGKSSNVSYERNFLRRTQTPHGFRLEKICSLHRKANEQNISGTAASCELLVKLGEKCYFSQGSEKNLKLTTPDDLEIFKALLKVGKN